MLPKPATFIGVHLRDANAPLTHRLPRTLRELRQHTYKPVSPHRSAHYPKGEPIVQSLYSLAHGGCRLPSLVRLEPHHTRTMRDIMHRCRRNKSGLHLIGVLDTESPYGNRRLVEQVMRLLRHATVPVYLHLGAWNTTPSERKYAQREIASLVAPPIHLASIFPLEHILTRSGASQFVDSLSAPNRTLSSPYYVSLPSTDSDYIAILNHQLHGLDNFVNVANERYPDRVVCFPVAIQPCGHVAEALPKHRHIVGVSSRPSYLDAFFGHHSAHPYLETLVVDSPVDMLEMLISPHYGYSQEPYSTVVLVEELRHRDFDAVLAHYLKRRSKHPLACVLLEPHALTDDLGFYSEEAHVHPFTASFIR